MNYYWYDLVYLEKVEYFFLSFVARTNNFSGEKRTQNLSSH